MTTDVSKGPSGSVEVQGTVAPGFGAVKDAFAANFEAGLEVGAACAVYRDGVQVVNIWGGVADPTTGRSWDEHTLAHVYSVTKGVTATCALLLLQRGELEVDAPVAQYWPEFAANGKTDVPVRMILNHQVGLPCVDREVTLDEYLAVTPVIEALAEQAPLWQPGSKHGYHAVTFGWLVGELVRRISGRRIGQYLAEEIAGPLGLDMYIGLPAEEHRRMARIVYPPPLGEGPRPQEPEPEMVELMAKAASTLADPSSMSARALFMHVPGISPEMVNDPRVWSAEIPAGNGAMDARSLARLYAALVSEVDGVRLLSEDIVGRAATEESSGIDAVMMGGIGEESRFGLGYMLPSRTSPFLGPASFGHPGAGGALGFADRESRVGFGYVMNFMGQAPLSPDRRQLRLLTAVRASLG